MIKLDFMILTLSKNLRSCYISFMRLVSSWYLPTRIRFLK